METKIDVFSPSSTSRNEVDRALNARRSSPIERIAKWRWFLTPVRLIVSLILFSLGFWSHSAYNAHVTLQNTQRLHHQLNRTRQRVDSLTAQLMADEVQFGQVDVDIHNRLTRMERRLRAAKKDIVTDQRALQRLSREQARRWDEWPAIMNRRRQRNRARWSQLRWEMERTFGALAREVDVARDRAAAAHHALLEANQARAQLQAVQDSHTRRLARLNGEVAGLSRQSDYAYVPFEVNRARGRQSVGDIQVQLKKTNVKKRRYSLILFVGETKMIEKNRILDELISFTVGDEKRPHQFVVKHIARDRVIGYLKIPQLLVGKLEPVSLPEQKLEPRRVDPARQSMEEFPHLTHREE